MHKHILLVTSDLANNAMGRVWILADMLSRYARVEILGMAAQGKVWPPLEGNNTHKILMLPVKTMNPLLALPGLIRNIRRHPAGAIYVCKPRLHTLLAALIARRGRPVILDIDDWEAGLARAGFSPNPVVRFLAGQGISFTALAERLIPLALAKTVSNVFLQQKYGGTVIAHARDASRFNSAAALLFAVKKEYALPSDKKIALFFGTPHKHKGIPELIEAVALAKRDELHLVIAGMDPHAPHYNDYRKHATQLLGGRVTFLPFIGWQKGPLLLQCSDIIIIPQKMTPFTQWGQTPAKVFDAMAAGKPLIVSDVADIRDIVADTAWVVPPDNVQAIAAALHDICDHPAEAVQKAALAKARFLAQFSYDVVAPKLAAVFA